MSSIWRPILIITIAALTLIQAQIYAPNTPPQVTVALNPSSILPASQTQVTLTATGTSVFTGCSMTRYRWHLMSSPAGSTPVIVSPQATTTNVTGLGTLGLYKFNVTVQDCNQTSTTLDVNVRVADSTAHIRAVADGYGMLVWNGVLTAPINGFVDADSLSLTIPTVNPGDVFVLIGVNVPISSSSGFNPAALAATIQWRDTNFNTDAIHWRCTPYNLTEYYNGNTAWMKPHYNDSWMDAAFDQGNNTYPNPSNGNKTLNVAPEAELIWWQATWRYPGNDSSKCFCRYIFTPTQDLITPVYVMSSPNPVPLTTASPTIKPTITPTPTPTPTATPTATVTATPTSSMPTSTPTGVTPTPAPTVPVDTGTASTTSPPTDTTGAPTTAAPSTLAPTPTTVAPTDSGPLSGTTAPPVSSAGLIGSSASSVSDIVVIAAPVGGALVLTCVCVSCYYYYRRRGVSRDTLNRTTAMVANSVVLDLIVRDHMQAKHKSNISHSDNHSTNHNTIELTKEYHEQPTPQGSTSQPPSTKQAFTSVSPITASGGSLAGTGTGTGTSTGTGAGTARSTYSAIARGSFFDEPSPRLFAAESVG